MFFAIVRGVWRLGYLLRVHLCVCCVLRVSRSLYCSYCGPWEESERGREGLNSQLGLQDRLSVGARTVLLLVITVCVFCMYISSNSQQVGRRTTAIHLVLSCSNTSSGSSADVVGIYATDAATERGRQQG